MCWLKGEITSTKFIHYREICTPIFMMFNSWRTEIISLLCWSRKFADPLAKAVWMMILLCIWWCLWRERNQRCFDDSAMSLARLQDSFLLSLYVWANALLGGPFLDFHILLAFLLVCFE